jgi:hypothetical protein
MQGHPEDTEELEQTDNGPALVVDSLGALDRQYTAHRRVRSTALQQHGLLQPYYGSAATSSTSAPLASGGQAGSTSEPRRKRRRKVAAARAPLENAPGLCSWLADCAAGLRATNARFRWAPEATGNGEAAALSAAPADASQAVHSLMLLDGAELTESNISRAVGTLASESPGGPG